MSATARPLVSLLLTTYNHARFVRQAIESALAQTYSPLEIIISDDASQDETWAIVEEAVRGYAGPHQLVLNRNTVNQGIGAHLSQLAARAKGELLFVAAGDDISLPTRCEHVVDLWLAQEGKPDLIACDLQDMAQDGTLHGVIRVDDLAQWRSVADWVQGIPYLVGAGHTWHRRLFERFGPLDRGVRMEDQIMVFRAVAEGRAITLSEPLVQYRRGGTSGRIRSFSAAEVSGRWLKGNPYAIAETEQILRDADRLGLRELAMQRCGPILARELYLRDIFAAQGTLAKLAIFKRATGVPMRWRVRILMYAAFPFVLAPLFGLKRAVAALRGK